MKRSFSGLALALILSAGPIGTANATLFQTGDPGGSFDLGSGWVGQGDTYTLNVTWTVDGGFANQAFNLTNAGDTFTVHFATAYFGSEYSIGSNETDNLSITANIDLVLPETLGLASIGVVGTVTGNTGDGAVDVTVDFAPVQVAFGSGGLLNLDLSPVSFNNDHRTDRIYAQFSLGSPNDDQRVAVAEPSTLALFSLGLIALGMLRRRRIGARADKDSPDRRAG